MKRKWVILSFMIFVLGGMAGGGLWEWTWGHNPGGDDIIEQSFVKEAFDRADVNLVGMSPRDATIWMSCHIIKEIRGLKKSTVVYAVWGILGAFVWNVLFGPLATGVLRGEKKKLP